MRTVREEDSVRLAVDAAEDKWERAADAWLTLTWVLSFDPEVGVPLSESGTVRAFVYEGARSIAMPSIEVTYVIEGQIVTIKDVEFYDAKNHFGGRA